jgi:beta-galactosidase
LNWFILIRLVVFLDSNDIFVHLKINEKWRDRMKRKWVIAAAIGMAFISDISWSQAARIPVNLKHAVPIPLTVTAEGFRLNGKPFQIISGELEYARIPRADWRQRLRMAHALGLNSITVYVFWNLHEPKPGLYDFTGQNDVAEYLRDAQQEGLYVILRPGPYVCAEWDLGGYPAWLLKDHAMQLRSIQPQFMAAASRWIHRLGQELAPLQASHGGPIIAVQVENEYGSFGSDHSYVEQMHQLLLDSGFTGSLLYPADGADVLDKGSLPELFAAIDFGTGDASRSIALLKKFRPKTPIYAAEYWDGWFDHWGEKHQTTNAAQQEAEIRSLLEQGNSVSLYMVHGGSTFGWMNGANNDHGGYQPDVSSYDYDAPIDESGRPRPKYFTLRTIIAQATRTTPPPVPQFPPLLTLPPQTLRRSFSLWSALPRPIEAVHPLSMEDVDQAYGYILYRTQIKGETGRQILSFTALHSYARVYLDGRLAGSIDRRLGQKSLELTLHGTEQLDVLVENSGRVNFTPAIRGERTGIVGAVSLANNPLEHWQIFRLPLNEPPSGSYLQQSCTGPCFYQGEFFLDKIGDTYLSTERLGKGVVWINGHLLGRFWNIGPMGSLFLPSAWLKTGANQITVFDLNGGTEVTVEGREHAVIFEPRSETTAPLTR